MTDKAPEIKIDEIVRSNRKTIAFYIKSDARFIVRAPFKAPERLIFEFVEKKKDWIIKTQGKAREKHKTIVRKEYVSGEKFLYLGKIYTLDFDSGIEEVTLTEDKILLPDSAREKARENLLRWYLHRAYEIIPKSVPLLSVHSGLKYSSVKLSNAKRRWGSCSTKNTINLSWRLIMASQEVIDYVVVHELVHTEVRNHSKSFWDKVGKLMPDYKHRLKWLKENQNLIFGHFAKK